MLEVARTGAIPRERNGGARKIQGHSTRVGHHFHRAGIVDVHGRSRRFERPDLDTLVFHYCEQRGDLLGLCHRLVTLDVDVDVRYCGLGDLVHPLGAAAVLGGSHARVPLVAPAYVHDFVGIGGDDDVIEQRGGLDRVVHAPEQRLSRDVAQHLSRQARRGQPGWNDGNGFHGWSSMTVEY